MIFNKQEINTGRQMCVDLATALCSWGALEGQCGAGADEDG